MAVPPGDVPRVTYCKACADAIEDDRPPGRQAGPTVDRLERRSSVDRLEQAKARLAWVDQRNRQKRGIL